jgi:hypothetical protein
VIAPLDLYRTANVLIQQYGPEEALLVAAKRDIRSASSDDGTRKS